MCAPHRVASDDTPGSASCLPGRGAKSLGGGADARDIRECEASCLATVLEVLLRAGFVASMPGTPEFCPRKDTPQVVL